MEHAWIQDADTVSSTDAKNLFGAMLDKAVAGRRVVITRHGGPKAVLVGIEEYEALTRTGAPALDALSAAFDARLERMQTAKARAATKKAFDATPKQLGRAAVNAARTRRGRAAAARRRG